MSICLVSVSNCREPSGVAANLLEINLNKKNINSDYYSLKTVLACRDVDTQCILVKNHVTNTVEETLNINC